MYEPGSWTLEARTNGHQITRQLEGGDTEIVAVCHAADNAAFIAAAPSLLAALQAVADYWAGGDVPAEIDAQMRAAIASATGADQ